MSDSLDLDSSEELARDAEPALVGQTLGGRYLIQRRLGTGGMGAVYLAEHVHMKKPVAVKVLHPEMTAMPEVVARFEREAIASARIVHPNVVNATDFGKLPDGSFYLVLAYVAGTSLTDVIKADAPLAEERACYFALQIAEALAAAHAAGVVHRDLKPDNVMILAGADDTEHVKVLDFGIAKIQSTGSGDTQKLTRAGSIFGTPDYMSPEQAAGRPVDHRCDLYALGVMLYEMLSGKLPFVANEIMVLLTLHLTQPPPPLPKSVTPALAKLVMKLLEKEPDDRIQTASELVTRLKPFVASKHLLPGEAPVSLGAPRISELALDVASRWSAAASERLKSSRDIKVPLWQGLAGVVVLVLLGWLLFRDGKEQAPGGNTASGAVASESTKNPDVPENPKGLPLDAAARGDRAAMKTLLDVEEEDRDAEVWFSLARGHSELMEVEPALDAYEKALKKDSNLARSTTLTRDLRALAEHPQGFKRAQRLAVEYLGERGVDLLFDVWADSSSKSPHTANAKRLLDDPAVTKKASAALLVALELRRTQGCKGYQTLLPRVRKFGDTRSLSRVTRLQAKEGCGFLGIEDCYACLRGGNLVGTTIAAIKERPAPRL